MSTSLPSRPNLDQLRRQAKELLTSLADPKGNADHFATLRENLPAARGMTDSQIRATGFRLADAQAAIARCRGFASWPRLARHVEQLRLLEGTWSFTSLEVDGQAVPAAAVSSSRLLIDGDRFRMESPEATYEGVFNIDVEAEPHHIDIEFVEGPEAGKWNYGIFKVEKEQLHICLDMNGKPRPNAFRTARGSGHAFEVLTRDSGTRPEKVDGGTRSAGGTGAAGAPDASGFAYAPSTLLTKLAGEWDAVKLVRDGEEFPAPMRTMMRRIARQNEVEISAGGRTIIQALIRIDEAKTPVHVDYFNTGGMAKGAIQLGIMEWRGAHACFCMGSPGGNRPAEFESPKGSGHTLSIWKKT